MTTDTHTTHTQRCMQKVSDLKLKAPAATQSPHPPVFFFQHNPSSMKYHGSKTDLEVRLETSLNVLNISTHCSESEGASEINPQSHDLAVPLKARRLNAVAQELISTAHFISLVCR